MKKSYSIHTMRREELRMAIDWAKREGWNPGLHDAEAFHAAEPVGYLVGELDGIPVATISAVGYGRDFGFIGLYIVKEEYRGMGFGLAIWQEACRRLDGRIVGLDGVVAQQDNYRRSGFELAYSHIRFRGRTTDDLASCRARRLAPGDFNAITALDEKYFGTVRRDFLRVFCFAPGTRTVGIDDGRGGLAGYGTIRPCGDGWKLGPVFAPDRDTAAALVDALIATGTAGNFYWDVPEPNQAALELAVGRFGMTRVFETARMYRGGKWELPVSGIWGTTTLELG
ncbi:MAG: GNAT family N-acetyltransferase [Victivallaceae bacterium]|nr:GNAT family N-acetyltransferase [Victivallaceae bacterium]